MRVEDALLELCVETEHLLFGTPALVDVGVGAEPFHGAPLRVAQSHRLRVEPAVLAVMAADPELHAEVRPGCNGRLPRGHGERSVVEVDLVQPAEAQLRRLRNARVGHPLAAEIVARPLGFAGPDELGQRLGQLTEAALALAQVALRGDALGDVIEGPHPAGDGRTLHRGGGMALEHATVLEQQRVDVGGVRPVERLHLGEERLGIDQLVRDIGQERGIVPTLHQVVRDAPEVREATIRNKDVTGRCPRRGSHRRWSPGSLEDAPRSRAAAPRSAGAPRCPGRCRTGRAARRPRRRRGLWCSGT